MMKLLKKRLKNEKGLTLIEVLAVIVILAIVAAIAIPAIGNMIENSRIKSIKADAVNVINAANLYYTENGGGKDDFNGVDKGGEYVSSFGSISKDGLNVTRDGKITATGERGNVKIEFKGATIEDIKAEDSDDGNNIKITVSNEVILDFK